MPVFAKRQSDAVGASVRDERDTEHGRNFGLKSERMDEKYGVSFLWMGTGERSCGYG